MRLFGIIGRPLGHSWSRGWFNERFAAKRAGGAEGDGGSNETRGAASGEGAGGAADCRFENFELSTIDDLDTLIAQHGDELCGFCVTIPYKQAILSRLSSISPEAHAIGAVNCVKMFRDDFGKLHLAGFNTDAHGFRVGLEQLIGTERPQTLVLGTGGASRAVRHVLQSVGIDFRMVSRTGDPTDDKVLTYNELTSEIVASHRLIVNTTPLGTYPDTESKPPIPYDAIGPGHFLYDLVYNPPLTAFLAEGTRRGAKTMGGLTMLHAQAEQNAILWNV
jgi:shikimate dehydrogenase